MPCSGVQCKINLLLVVYYVIIVAYKIYFKLLFLEDVLGGCIILLDPSEDPPSISVLGVHRTQSAPPIITSFFPLTVCIFFARFSIDSGRYGITEGGRGSGVDMAGDDEDFLTMLVARV